MSETDLTALLALVPVKFKPAAALAFPLVWQTMQEVDLADPCERAYVFATLHHETGCGHWMEEIWQASAAQQTYEGRADLGNHQQGDGYRFRGRGFVQITGRKNYEDWSKRLGLDLIADPDLAKKPENAAKVLVIGMQVGSFRAAKLNDFHQSGAYDFLSAREIVNGDKARFSPRLGMTIGEHIRDLAKGYLGAVSKILESRGPENR